MKNTIFFERIVSFSCCIMIIFFTLMPSEAKATFYYVSIAGNDSNVGTDESYPLRTIKKGVSRLGAGDTLYVKTGTYSESILSWITPIPNGTSWNNPVTVAAFPGHKVTITPPIGKPFFRIQDGQAKYLIIDGFIVDGQNKIKNGFKFSNNTRYVRIQNTEIKNAYQQGILVTVCTGCPNPEALPWDTYHEFINLKVHHNGTNVWDHGFYISTSSNLIEKSEIYANSGFGVHLYYSYASSPSVNANIVRLNKVYNNSTSGKWSCGILLSSGKNNIAERNIVYGNLLGICSAFNSTNTKIYNNIVYENENVGIYVGQRGSERTLVYNNTNYSNGAYGIFVGHGSRNSVLQNNIAYLSGNEDIHLEPNDQTGTVVSFNLTADPKFVNSLSKDFNLQQESLAIDGGIALNEIISDYDGVERPQGLAHDIGAFEFPQAAPAPPQASQDNEPPGSPLSVNIF